MRLKKLHSTTNCTTEALGRLVYFLNLVPGSLWGRGTVGEGKGTMNHTIVMIEYRPVSQDKWKLLAECPNARVIFETFDEAKAAIDRLRREGNIVGCEMRAVVMQPAYSVPVTELEEVQNA